MNKTSSVDAARVEPLLSELRLPAIKLMWATFAEQLDKQGWPAARFTVLCSKRRPIGIGRWVTESRRAGTGDAPGFRR